MSTRRPARPGQQTPASPPNGIGLSPDGGTLYVSDYGGVNVWSFKVQPDGSLADKKVLMTMKRRRTSRRSPTGTADRRLRRSVYATALGLQIFDPAGKLLGVLPKPGNGPLAAGFGGKTSTSRISPAATSCTADPRR